ncbi:hypothetical protein [Luteimonas suaedae]|uniref:hypothetical protein n=1 Tax=Luteimonas suaedae TaxID=2605430 RepID=UPI0016592F79|nr:hypothetical protein [Luteimonas suaedae]
MRAMPWAHLAPAIARLLREPEGASVPGIPRRRTARGIARMARSYGCAEGGRRRTVR